MAARRASGTKRLDVLMVGLPGRERIEAEWRAVDDTMRRCIRRLYRPAEVVAVLTAHREGLGR